MRITTQATLFVSAVALASGVLTGVLFWRLATRTADEAVLDQQALFASQSAAALRTEFEFARRELAALSQMVAVDLDDDDPSPEERLVREAYQLTPFFFAAGVTLVDTEGRCHAAEPSGCGQMANRSTEWIESGREGEGSHLIFTPASDHDAELVVSIRDSDGELHGVLLGAARLHGDDLMDEPVRGSRVVPHAMAIVDANGDVLFHEGDEILRGSGWDPDVSAPAWFHDHGQEMLVFAASEVGEQGERLVHAWRLADLDTHAVARKKTAIASMICATLFGLLVGGLAAQSLTRPIRALTSDVALAREKRAPLPRASGKDEVTELRNSFAELVEQLRTREARAQANRDEVAELAATLEQRVDQRTAELEQAQDALLESERMAALGRAGAALSHEIRNCLNGLSVGFDAMGSGLPKESNDRIRNELRSEIARMRTLSDTLLDFARTREVRLREMSLDEFLDRSVAVVEARIDEHQVELEVNAIDLRVKLDPDLMVSVVSNLLDNAIDAVVGLPADKRRIELRCQENEGRVEFLVSDSGTGVPAKIQETLFEPFVSGMVGGVGLGLALARRFTEMHHGTLTHCASLMGGECFIVSLPETANSPEATS